MGDGAHVEVDVAQACKHGQYVCGDAFHSRRLAEENRVVCALADGLGSGIKASAMATLTSSLALRCLCHERAADRTAALIRDILPVCASRGIAYSTFTLLDISGGSHLHLIESENPAALFLRDGRVADLPRRDLAPDTCASRPRVLRAAAMELREGDRLALYSDGVSQAGMGAEGSPLGWGPAGVTAFVACAVQRAPAISARALARAVIDEAIRRDGGTARDDMTCAVAYVRHPRELLVVTGPPYRREQDRLMAAMTDAFAGRRIICGGTTAGLVARELGREAEVDAGPRDAGLPPPSCMPGVDLITEGALTLAAVARLLESPESLESAPRSAATRVVDLMLDSDIVHFLVGTRINEAHQDPAVPVELDIRRNVVRRIRDRLERGFLKETRMRFL